MKNMLIQIMIKKCLKYLKDEMKLKINNSLDFDDLLMQPIVLFKIYPDVLEQYQEKYKYILIDEYQDTNEAQYVLVKMLSKKYKNICVVGDESQSIYSFRGSNYRNILNFEKDFPSSKVVLLEQNYRSTKTILKSANNVIKNNKQKKDKNYGLIMKMVKKLIIIEQLMKKMNHIMLQLKLKD